MAIDDGAKIECQPLAVDGRQNEASLDPICPTRPPGPRPQAQPACSTLSILARVRGRRSASAHRDGDGIHAGREELAARWAEASRVGCSLTSERVDCLPVTLKG